ncbi:unnamed protein product [Larinioides sclopetarius]|uniref:Uncharacterized protein n=1 Tax=Larinioides sclopetarius TaxID=280406 RepID=A0AAV2BVD7_9ARAC
MLSCQENEKKLMNGMFRSFVVVHLLKKRILYGNKLTVVPVLMLFLYLGLVAKAV